MGNNNYIDMMIDSLNKKVTILEKISECNEMQRQTVTAENFDADQFNDLVEQSNELILEINKLDDGFEMLYDRVRDDLQHNKEGYADEINTMQGLISKIIGLTSSIEADEKRLKSEVENRFSRLKQNIRESRKNGRIVSNYYKSMAKINSEPQFMDRKK